MSKSAGWKPFAASASTFGAAFSKLYATQFSKSWTVLSFSQTTALYRRMGFFGAERLSARSVVEVDLRFSAMPVIQVLAVWSAFFLPNRIGTLPDSLFTDRLPLSRGNSG